MNKQWIECGVAPGMFSDERAVEVRGRWYFVEAERVRASQAEGRGQLEVEIHTADGVRWAVIPSCEQPVVALAD